MPNIGGRSEALESPSPVPVEQLAQEFLRALPNVRRGELVSEDQRCVVCLEQYGTTPSERGITERPKRLPCGHILGEECIIRWVSPSHENKHSCPICRYKLYEAHPGPCTELEHIANDEGLMNLINAINDGIETEELQSEREITDAGTADHDVGTGMRRTLARTFEEFMLYRLLVDRDAPLPLAENGTISQLNGNQEAELISELRRRRAFDQARGMGGHGEEYLTDEEMWRRMSSGGYHYKLDYRIEESIRGGGWFTATYRLGDGILEA